ncbi:PaaI family thioesterase [Actinoallomurus rhizosphaericola]|uniref:PaaI family thioesterase n=1 Tax=Actinoallomurus rhizosphaericola TaxID=2952536 RepID=UPI002092862B|nr:acyl-CoA thioesterase domain-containing protein [Actinoallomurus rhizosphaericola]MCO5999819.1 thioesterase family protein [Actinoallomurus rhizosphaericola]
MSKRDIWLAESPFLRDLGVQWSEGETVLNVAEPHTAAGALHGGAVAALAMASAQATMRTSDPDLDPATTSLHVTYARPGLGSVFTASSSTLRRARELGFYQTEIRDGSGTVIAGASSTLSAARREESVVEPMPPLLGDPAEFAEQTEAIPFLTRRGLHVQGIESGAIEITMAPVERNLDGRGRIHEGALLTLIDLAGTSVPWTHSRPSPRGATIALHAQLAGEPSDGAVVARARLRAHDDRVFWCDIDVFTGMTRRLRARGSMVYRYA